VVEQALVTQQIGVPTPREQRSLMKDEERNPPDMTQHLVRDWGILIKYRDYVHYWQKFLHKMLKNRKAGNLRVNKSHAHLQRNRKHDKVPDSSKFSGFRNQTSES